MANLLGTIYAEIRLRLDQFRQDIADANTEIRTMQDDLSRSLSACTKMGDNLTKAGKTMSKYVTAPIFQELPQSVQVLFDASRR